MGKRKILHRSVLILAVSSLMMVFCFCSKETNDTKPVVEIFSPIENQSFQIGDSIYVSAKASDDNEITSISVTLTDNNYFVKDYSAIIPVTGNPQLINLWYKPSDMQLPTGDYYIQVKVSNRKNTKYKYRQIRLTQGQQSRKTLLVITRQGDGSFSLGTLDPDTLELLHRGTWNHTYASSGIYEHSGQLYLLGRGFGECYAVNLETYTVDFKLAQTGTPSVYYHEQLLAGSDRFFIGLTEGYIKGYNKAGVQQFITTLTEGRKPGKMAAHLSYLIVAEREKASQGSWIAASYLSSGLRWKDYKLPDRFEVVSIQPLSNDEVLVAGNIDGSGRLIIWNFSANSVTTTLQLNSELIFDMEKLNQSTFLLATDKEILAYNSYNESISSFLQNAGALQIHIDQSSGRLYVGNQGGISAYNYLAKTLLWQKPLPGGLAAFYLQYE